MDRTSGIRIKSVPLVTTAVVAVAVVIAIIAVLHGAPAKSSVASGAHASPTLSAGTDMQLHAAAAFTLPDQNGASVSLQALRGHPVVLTFLDATCTEQCPIMVQYLNWTASFLTPQQVSRIEWVAITVNPNNTPAEASAFLTKNKAAMPFHFLLGTQAQLQPLWKAYYIEAQPGQTDVVHTSGLYVIDQRGHEREWVDAAFDPKALASDLKTMVGGQ